jgi:predicted Zn-dependent protease
MDDITDALIAKGDSRDTEFEAERVGLEIMVRAGYPPQGGRAHRQARGLPRVQM